MEVRVYNTNLVIDWNLLNMLNRVERFDESWKYVSKINHQSLESIKQEAIEKNVIASCKISGVDVDSKTVREILNNIYTTQIENRDTEHIIGYYNALNMVLKTYDDLFLTDSTLKSLHSELLRYSTKDRWHKGEYKQQKNNIETVHVDGSKETVLKTTEPGITTDKEMHNLLIWYIREKEMNPLVKIACFIYEFLCIRPFQEENETLSRLISMMLLMQSGYYWIQYTNFEEEISDSLRDYFLSLRNCQSKRPNENITQWVTFFLESLENIQNALLSNFEYKAENSGLTPKEKSIYLYVINHTGCKSGEVAKSLNIPNPTVKRILTKFVNKDLIERFGQGAGTSYGVKELVV